MAKSTNKTTNTNRTSKDADAIHAKDISSEEIEVLDSDFEEGSSSSEEEEIALADRLKSIEGVNEDAAEFMAENWSKFLGLLVLGILGLFAYNGVKNVGAKKSNEASDRFIQVQDRLTKLSQVDLEGKDENSEIVKEAAKNNKALFDSLDVLSSSFNDSFYGQVAPLYQAKALIEEGQILQAREILSKVQSDFSNAAAGEVNGRLLIKEFAELLDAKSYLLEKDTNIELGTQKLKDLAFSSEILSAEALVSLINLAKTSEERSEILSISREVVAKKPRFRDQLKSAFLPFGLKLEEESSS